MTERTLRIETLLDVYLLLPELYSESSAKAYESSFGRIERLTGRRLSQISADVVEWEQLAAEIVWAGEFTRARTPEARQRAFDGFVGRVSAAIRRARERARPGRPRPVPMPRPHGSGSPGMSRPRRTPTMPKGKPSCPTRPRSPSRTCARDWAGSLR